MNADLLNSLRGSHKTIASVTSQNQADKCIAEGHDYWIKQHLGHSWCIVDVPITLALTITKAVSSKLVTREELGILQRYSLFGRAFQHTLFVYSSDKYTETWVHSLILAAATDPSNRILNVQRDDPGELIDLGSFKLT